MGSLLIRNTESYIKVSFHLLYFQTKSDRDCPNNYSLLFGVKHEE